MVQEPGKAVNSGDICTVQTFSQFSQGFHPFCRDQGPVDIGEPDEQGRTLSGKIPDPG